MKILLTNSPSYIKDMNRRFTYGSRFACILNHPHKHKMGFYTPYMWSMGYSSSILKKDTDHNVKALDAQAKVFNDSEFIKEVKKYSPDLMVLDLPTISFSFMVELVRNLKADIGCKIGVGGLHLSGIPKETMEENDFIDFGLAGEYQLIIEDLLKAIEGKKKMKDVPNLYFRENGKVIKTDFSKGPFLGIDFDSLPYPDRDEMPVCEYHDMEINGGYAAQMLTSRGCPHQCRFCCSTVYWPNGAYWQRKPERVVDEMEFVKEHYNPKSIYFDDDVVLPNMLEGMIKEILERKLDMPWTFMGSINTSKKTIEDAAKAGCIGMKFGIESITPEVLSAINKSWIKKERVKEFNQICKDNGIFTHGTFIIGLPQDRKENLLKTLEFLKEIDMNSYQFYTMVPLPGTPFYYEAKEKGWIMKDKENKWECYDGNNPIMSYPWFTNSQIKEVFEKWHQFGYRTRIMDRLKNPRKLARSLLHTPPKYTLLKMKNIIKGAKCPM